ncbi:MAG: hypothetical protein K2X08_07750 [Chlamydiales bacterium]|nr:hypothetical protein [Chlamydiales bacterium]MBY0529658.1 hypothetical protein [Rhabdochlamydiaceae bacterium]
MSYYLTISKALSCQPNHDQVHPSQKILLKNKDEYTLVSTLCNDTTNMAGPLKASLIPIRTDSANILPDLLIPNITRTLIKTKQASSCCFAILTILWDLVTLPSRFLTLIPRIFYNTCVSSREHPLVLFLKEKGVDPVYLSGEVIVKAYMENKKFDLSQEGHEYELHLGTQEVPFSRFHTGFTLIHPAGVHSPWDNSKIRTRFAT